MSRRLIFWVLMLIWAVFALFVGYNGPMAGGYHIAFAGQFLEFVLFLLLGWQVYGRPIE